MSRIVVLGAGFSGHTVALFLRKQLPMEHEVHVISPQSFFQYMPSLVWAGIGQMQPERTTMELAPIYRKQKIRFTVARAATINVDQQTVETDKGDQFPFDYLVNATGPYLNFEGTPGLGPEKGFTSSICTKSHAIEAAEKYHVALEKMRQGKRQTIVVGTGHAASTCQGAAFEYIQNIHFDLQHKGLRDLCDLIWFSNEPRLGDLGMGAFVFNVKGELRESEELTAWLLGDCGIRHMVGARPVKIEPGKLFWENVQGQEGCLDFDFAMLIPQFTGQKLNYVNSSGELINDRMCNPAGFMKVDADYTSGSRGYDNYRPEDWPGTYQSPLYPNLFAAGIAFAPPHPVSAPSGTTSSGALIHASPPRTGMISCIIGKLLADNITTLVLHGPKAQLKKLSMSQMPAVCVASQRKSVWNGSAIMVALYPVVPDYGKYSRAHGGRDMSVTTYEIGKASAWLKYILHYVFLYKMAAKPGWHLIPE